MFRCLPLVLLALLAGQLAGRPLLADPLPEKITIATWNLEWFYDDYKGDNSSDLAKEQSAPSRAEWDWKLQGVAAAIAKIQPTILCLQEIENRRVLFYLTQQLKKEHNLQYKIAYIEGGDFFTEQDVGILYLSGLVEFGCREQSQEMRAEKEYYYLNKHLFARFAWGEGDRRVELLLLNMHLRAQGDAAAIRTRQAKLARKFVAAEVAAGQNVVLIGDLNSDEGFADTTKTGEIGVMRGLDTESPDDDLVDLHAKLPADGQVTHIIGKQFDRIIVSPRMVSGEGKAKARLALQSVAVRKELCIRGEADKDHWNIYWTIPQAERDLSDHWPLVAEFQVQTMP